MNMSKVWYRINCGSAEVFTDGAGDVWQADHLVSAPAGSAVPALGPGGWCCVGGKSAAREADLPLFPAGLAGLLRTECYGMSSYRFALPAGGYTVRLVVGETFETLKTLERTFTLSLNGQPLREALQPSAVAQGFGRAGQVIIKGVRLAGDELRIEFSAGASIYGIEIRTGQPGDQFSIECAALAPACVAPVASGATRTIRFLFIGHSGTFFWAIPETVARMVALNHPSVRLAIAAFYAGGKGVQFFFESPEVQSKLQNERFDFVVLQDSSWGPIEHPEEFEMYMPKLIASVRAAGATPILYAYSGPLRHTAEQRQHLQDRYSDMGRRMGVPVVPCAAALLRVLAEDPQQNYHNPDKHHLGMLAGYLFACCWYRALCGQSARNHTEHTTLAGHVQVPAAKARYLADISDQVCSAHKIGETEATAILSDYLK